MERARHERVILDGIAEDDELRAAEAVALARQLRRFLHDLPHAAHGVHVDAGLRRRNVDACADEIGLGQRARDGGQQPPVALGAALVDERGKSADEVHAAGLCRGVHRLREGDIVLRLACPGDERNGRDGDALVDDGDAELPLDLAAGGHEVFRRAADLVVNFLRTALCVRICAIQQRDPHCDGADVEMLMVDHIDRGHDVRVIQHGPSLRSCASRRRCPRAGCGWRAAFPRPWRRGGAGSHRTQARPRCS